MSIIDKYKRGEIGADELIIQAKADPAILAQAKQILGQDLSDAELENIIGGASDTQTVGIRVGTEGDDSMRGSQIADYMYGQGGDDTMFGGQGDDVMDGGDGNDIMDGGQGDDQLDGGAGNDDIYGGTGADTLDGGEGNDTLDGGWQDHADDVAEGGAGDDIYIWGTTGEGNDTFDGGEGNDVVQLEIMYGEPSSTVQQAMENGAITIELFDAHGNPLEVTDDMWDDQGNLQVPEGAHGTVTGLADEYSGEEAKTLTFTNVETIIL